MTNKTGRTGHPTAVTLVFKSTLAAENFLKAAEWDWDTEDGWKRDRENLRFKTLGGKVADRDEHGKDPADWDTHTAQFDSLRKL